MTSTIASHAGKGFRLGISGIRWRVQSESCALIASAKIGDKGIDVSEEYLSFADSLTLRSGDVVSPAIGMREPLLQECLHFIDCIRSGSEPLSGGPEGLDVLRVLDAGQRSLEAGGAPISL